MTSSMRSVRAWDGLVLEVVRNVLIFELRAEAFFMPDDGAVLDQIDEALEAAFDADREIEDRRLGAEALDDRLDAISKLAPGAVELV